MKLVLPHKWWSCKFTTPSTDRAGEILGDYEWQNERRQMGIY
jgi:hypothetical protein